MPCRKLYEIGIIHPWQKEVNLIQLALSQSGKDSEGNGD